MNGQQEVVDQPQQLHVGGRAEDLLDDLDEGQADLLRDGGQVLVPVLLPVKQQSGVGLKGDGEGQRLDGGGGDVPARPGR